MHSFLATKMNIILAQLKCALRQHREEAKDHVVRNIGDIILKFV